MPNYLFHEDVILPFDAEHIDKGFLNDNLLAEMIVRNLDIDHICISENNEYLYARKVNNHKLYCRIMIESY